MEKLTKITKFSTAIKQAEKIIGYPTSFLNLRWIVNDEIANIAVHFKKLLETKHPLLKKARQLLLTNNLPSWGLIVLLVSKMVGNDKLNRSIDLHDGRSGILHSQRVLAEVIEMLRTSNIIHKGIVDTQQQKDHVMLFGNKMSVLGGDYLLARSFKELASLRNSFLHEMVSSSVRDMMEAQFLGVRDSQNVPLPSKPKLPQEHIPIPNHYEPNPIDSRNILGHMQSEWTLRSILDGGNLLARACQSTLQLSGESTEIQNYGYLLGKHIALLTQANLDISTFLNDKFNLVTAPLMLHLEDKPDFYREIEKGLDNTNNVDFEIIKNEVSKGDGIKKTQRLKDVHYEKCLKILNQFPTSEARRALSQIIFNIKSFTKEELKD